MNNNTVVDALRNAGVPSDAPLTLTNPGGSNPWLFSLPASFAANAGAPVVLEVPVTQNNAIDLGTLNGVANTIRQAWYADGHGFVVRVTGTVQPVAFAKSFSLYLFTGNGLNSGTVGAVGTQELGQFTQTLPASGKPSAYSNFAIKAECMWDSSSLMLTGVMTGQIAGTNQSAVSFAIYNPSNWAAQQAAGAYLPIPFTVGVNLPSTANNPSNDSVTLTEFTADMN